MCNERKKKGRNLEKKFRITISRSILDWKFNFNTAIERVQL